MKRFPTTVLKPELNCPKTFVCLVIMPYTKWSRKAVKARRTITVLNLCYSLAAMVWALNVTHTIDHLHSVHIVMMEAKIMSFPQEV